MDFAATGNISSGKKALRFAGAQAIGLAETWKQLFQPVVTAVCNVLLKHVGAVLLVKWNVIFN